MFIVKVWDDLGFGEQIFNPVSVELNPICGELGFQYYYLSSPTLGNLLLRTSALFRATLGFFLFLTCLFPSGKVM